MSALKADDPAYPQAEGAHGLTVRQAFAKGAMEALIAGGATFNNEFDLHDTAVYHADALIRALNKSRSTT